MFDIFKQQHSNVLTRVSRNEILTWLKERVNKGYMPSATGERAHNSKPEYIPSIWARRLAMDASYDPELDKTPKLHPHDHSGFYMATDLYGYSVDAAPVYVLITFRGCQIRVNLNTLDMAVRSIREEDRAAQWLVGKSAIPEFVQWNYEQDTLALDRHAMIEHIDTYL